MDIKYAGDTILIADSEKKLQRIIEGVDVTGDELGLKINRIKTDCVIVTMRSEPTCILRIGKEPTKQPAN